MPTGFSVASPQADTTSRERSQAQRITFLSLLVKTYLSRLNLNDLT